MKKRNFLMMAALLFGMTLAACGGKPAEPSSEAPQPSTSEVPQPSSSEEPQPSSSEAPQPSSSEAPQPSSSEAPQPSSSEEPPAPQGEMAVNALDVIKEGEKVYLKIGGTISGFANADAMKMAFGLLDAAPAQGATAEWLIGSETPADADYTLVPTVNGSNFVLNVDVSIITEVTAGMYTIYVGPKGAYAAVGTSGVTMGTGKQVLSGYRWYIRSDKGALAMDELPPLELTESFIKVEGEGDEAAVYHYIGGALNTTKLPEADFLAKHPYVMYEQCVSWRENVLGSSTKTDLVTTVIQDGKAYLKTNISSLGDETYNIKINLSEDKNADVKMDAVIDCRDESDHVIFNGHAYAPYADASKTEKADIYGNCGLYISHAHDWTRGEQIADSELYQLTCGTSNHVGYELDLNTTNTPNLPSDKKLKGTTSTFNIAGITAGEYAVYFKAHVSSGNEGPNTKVGLSYGEQLDDNGSL